MNKTMVGSLAGVAATLPMTAAMTALHAALPEHRHDVFPRQRMAESTSETAERTSGNPIEAAIDMGDLTAHFGVGAAAGAGYAAFAGRSELPPALEGALYGLAVWGGAYLGIMPGTGLYKSPTDEPAQRHLLMLTAHLVWGASVGLLTALITNKLGASANGDESHP